MKQKIPLKTATMVETIYGCKWSLTIYALLREGINRPGEMVRSIDGLTTKVLNQCLRKNIEFGILDRKTFHEIPPRVEYFVTPFGEKFLKILDEIEELNRSIDPDPSH
ncbi:MULTISPECIES: winged helix-turn-helix transcriptional regulator [Legionella]|uniref:Helix-turn-helix transcriptional regulator n=1 Tax=Legionella resiliens TaxID=2905958 RepID=A0ABS8WZB2_9GAMM|nr:MULTISPECIES: helix-turn-helix domain-containing protein [unclassified Legionella]MCE0721717.1 helix-turn-helix transcriptional regulator [Legionella sp. 9fVS26]MCE3530871.1 helix-turn-helix transcriptional regulator [Legionella sp. 8cVS16]